MPLSRTPKNGQFYVTYFLPQTHRKSLRERKAPSDSPLQEVSFCLFPVDPGPRQQVILLTDQDMNPVL